MNTKNFKKLTKALLCSLMVVTLTSCLDDDDNNHYEFYRPTALVTVRPNADSTFTLQLDDKTTLFPTNLKTSPFGSLEVRALVNYTQEEGSDKNHVYVNWIDSIRTKKPVPTLHEQDNEVYGNDPIEIINDWVTVAEDGYLTLRTRTIWGYTHNKHFIDLVSGVNPENPYEFTLHHNAKGDLNGVMADALIAFNLNDLPRDGKEITIKVNWLSFEGARSTEFVLPEKPSVAHFGSADTGLSAHVE